MSTTVADASGSERYVGKSEHRAGWVCFFFTACISRFPDFAENEGNGWIMVFPRERQTPDWQPVPEQLIAASSTISLTVEEKPAPEFAEGPHFRHSQIWSLSN